MKTLSATVTTEKNAEQSAWCEVYDFYLKGAITTPWGSVSTLRLCTVPDGLSFFTPTVDPEPSGTQGNAQAYQFWPLKREIINGDAKFTNDKLTITASNVTTEWAAMIAAIDWEATPVVIRKVPLKAGLTNADCVILFAGQVDRPTISTEVVQLECSNDMAHFDVVIPREPMHAGCRFRHYDDQCTRIRYRTTEYKEKTCGASSTTTLVKSAGLTEDTGGSVVGTDLVGALPNASITASSELFGGEAWRVKAAGANWWMIDTTDWGLLTQGYWQIQDAQAGLANAALKPWVQFDFGVARTMRLWFLAGQPFNGFETLPRLVLFFSSTDGSTWKHETYFECPPKIGLLGEVKIPNAQSARYWRICVRSRWGPLMGNSLFEFVLGYEGSRHFWASGQIKFKSDTATVALRDVVATVRESYAGEIVVMPLPVAPASGDVFVIERGCPRTFNGCSERLNWENFGGFDSMPFETVVR